MAKVKYIEGQFYEFEFVKKVFIDTEFLVFKDNFGERHVIPSLHYRHYMLTPGQMVKCLITRVDCSGKLSIEPEHPFYKIGGTYEFDFVKVQVTEDNQYDPSLGKSKKIKEYSLIVADRDGNEHAVLPKSWQKKRHYKTDTIKCRLIKIVKGNFQLINLDEDKPAIRKLWDNISGNGNNSN